jgi:predicted ATP-dependent serine protease
MKEVKERFASVQAFATALEEACKAASSERTLPMLASDSPREHPVEAEQKSYQLNVRFHNLPAQLTPLIGRERDTGSVYTSAASRGALVTLTGPGGVGKTRLGLQVATELLDTLPTAFASSHWLP